MPGIEYVLAIRCQYGAKVEAGRKWVDHYISMLRAIEVGIKYLICSLRSGYLHIINARISDDLADPSPVCATMRLDESRHWI